MQIKLLFLPTNTLDQHSTDIPLIGSYELVDTQIDYQPAVDKV